MKFRYGLILMISYFQNYFMVTFLITHFYVFSKFETTAKTRPKFRRDIPNLPKIGLLRHYKKWIFAANRAYMDLQTGI